jgi:hypothetical protein
MNGNDAILAISQPKEFKLKIESIFKAPFPILTTRFGNKICAIIIKYLGQEEANRINLQYLQENRIKVVKLLTGKEITPSTANYYNEVKKAINDHVREFSFIKKLNDYIEQYFKKILLPNEFQAMQEIANRYNVNIKEGTLKQAYRIIASKTHPDKHQDATATADFIKAKQLSEQQDNPISIELYKPVIEQLCKVNIVIKVADTTIDMARGYREVSIDNGVKVGIDIAQLVGIYKGLSYIGLPISIGGAAYQAYKGNYADATTSIITTVGFGILTTTVYTTAPALGLGMSIGFTTYAGYGMMKNGYNLYNELYNEDINIRHEQDTQEDSENWTYYD